MEDINVSSAAANELFNIIYGDVINASSDQQTQELIDAISAEELERLFSLVCEDKAGCGLPGINQSRQKFTSIFPGTKVEERLVRRCCEVVDHFYQSVTAHDKRDLALTKAIQLPLKLKQKQERLSQLTLEELPRLEDELFLEIAEYSKTMNLAADTLIVLIKEFQCKYELEKNLAFSEYFCLIIRNIHLKISCMNFELDRLLFPKDIVQMMKDLKQQTDDTTRQLTEKRIKIDGELERYASAGPEFHQIVSEYQALLRDIGEVRRDLSMLQQR